ncbi:alpha/beta hydrolase [Candidatus Woesearchaeota archaeon]|nr:alpha/beta hydrolase [Candidatus Woesearchaeota archaeon]
MQSRLQDDGYLDAGIVSLYSQNEPLQKGIWGLSGKPVTVKASYYYDAFRKEDKYIVVPTKSESIDTYALRLRDLIDIVKERTSKPKVNIIAHSMGGLVIRRYIQIFGEDDIEKFIMIAVPNKGISGAASEYCGIIGENRECIDMQENSLFMNKLNDISKQPSKIKIYSIIGQGCQTSLGNGDGVVLAESAKFKDAKLFYVNGTCGGLFGESLHTEILNIEKYPETYGIISGILKE